MEDLPMDRAKTTLHFLFILSIIFFIQTFFLSVPAEAKEPPADSSFSRTISSIFSESGSADDKQVYEKISALKNDYSVLEVSNPASSAEESLIEDFEDKKAQYFKSGSADEPDAVTAAWDLEKQYMLFGFSGQETFLDFIPRIYVTDVSSSEEGQAIGIYEWMTVLYKDNSAGSESVSGYGYSYILNISGTNSGNTSSEDLSVSSVSGTKENFQELENEGVHITSSGVAYLNTGDASDEEGSCEDESDEDALVGADSGDLDVSWAYNTESAVAYADKWALGRNSAYTWWGDDGGDCSNFVSQCLYAGGFPKTESWYPDADTWIGQNPLREYLLKISAGKLITSPKQSDVRKGDIIWYNWDGKGTRTNHVTICVGTNSAGVPVIDSHTSARYHYKWNYGGSSTTYMVMQMKSHSSDYVPVYRLYNKNNGEHFYTGSEKERDYLQKSGWRYEGLGWIADNDDDGTIIYRLYNPNSGEHHYTAGKKEMEYLKSVGWKYEGQLCRTVKKSGVPLYRLYNPNAKTGSHHYTKNKKEAEYLEKQGWRYEGIAWYSKA